jgi:hypothetical protein
LTRVGSIDTTAATVITALCRSDPRRQRVQTDGRVMKIEVNRQVASPRRGHLVRVSPAAVKAAHGAFSPEGKCGAASPGFTHSYPTLLGSEQIGTN